MKSDIKEVFIEAFEPFAAAIQTDLVAIKGEMKEMKYELMGEMKRVEIKFDDKISYIHGSLEIIRKEIEEVKNQMNNIVYRHELESVKIRLDALERKISV